MWVLNSIILNNKWVKEEVSRNLIVFWTKWKKYNLSKFGGDSTQIVVKVNFIALQAYIRKEERSKLTT